MARDRVLIVGAGVAGLVAALELAHRGREVLVFDAAPRPGGKLRTVATPAGPVDAGPTVFTMAHVFEELFAAVGERLSRHLTLHAAPVLARHYWPDGSTLDLHADAARSEAAVAAFAGPRAAAEFRAFTARAARLFAAFEGPVMRHPHPTPASVARALVHRGAGLVGDMAPLSTLWSALGRQFADPRLRQLFARYATYVGGSPLLSPAILLLIWQSEARGVWAIEGGMVRLAEVLAELAAARGAVLRCDAAVAEILVSGGAVRGLRLASGEEVAGTTLIFNGDPGALATGLLGPASRRAAHAHPRSLSATVWTFAAPVAGRALSHHTVLFGPDSPAEFADIFTHGRLPRAPSVYICAQDRAGGAQPQPGVAERLLITVNAPADGDRISYGPEERHACRTRIMDRLAAAGIGVPLPDPVAEPSALTMPDGFAAAYPGTGGALYGAAPHGMMATFRRARAVTAITGLYLAGGGTHPGPGVPMSALSGRLAAAAIMGDPALTWPSGRTATRGGTWTDSNPEPAGASRSSPS